MKQPCLFDFKATQVSWLCLYFIDQLVQRVTDGFYSNKYKAVDYDALRALTQQKKIEGKASLVKVKKLQDASKRTKEHNLVNQHKAVCDDNILLFYKLVSDDFRNWSVSGDIIWF